MIPKIHEISEHDSSSEDDYFPSDDYLLNCAMEKKWDEVVKIYRHNPVSHKMKLTKSGETALHISIASYSSKKLSHFRQIEQMIDCIEKADELIKRRVLSMKNIRGDTPLHLAAGVGWVAICELLLSKNPELISSRNLLGETPLLVAAQQGKLQAVLFFFVYLHETNQYQETLRRRKDGNTILHAAISGEYFELAYQIISYCPELVSSVNADGETPLHILAKKPNAFKSNSQLGFYDQIIYHCLPVDKLKKERYKPVASEIGYSPRSEINLPGNYRTCADIFFLFWTPIFKTYSAAFRRSMNQSFCPTDEEIQAREEEEEDDERDFPPNYTTCMNTCMCLFNCVRSAIETTPAVIGIRKIVRIREIKTRHSNAFQVMSKMIESESRHTYIYNGQCPADLRSRFVIPETPPEVDRNDAEPNSSSGEKAPSHVLIHDTPLLAAVKTGILEMVKEIIARSPVAIQDMDPDGKNVLMLAAEKKQTPVFYFLLDICLPEYMSYQLDKNGNNALHLAAMLGELQPWRNYGATLQMHWEIKWYEYVKTWVPKACLIQKNAEGKTPRETFTETHAKLVEEGKQWLVKTSESCSVVAALIATVAFATSATVPGGPNDETGYPILGNHTMFDVFSLTSLIALSLSVTALVFFLSIITSRCEEHDFKTILPRKLFIGLTSLFASIAAMLVSFCAAHAFILRERLRPSAVSIYTIATIPMTLFTTAHMPFYLKLLWASYRKVPRRI